MQEKREHWGSKLGFVLAAAGSAIGLGTMWKLPSTMGQNGGGAFILLFLFFTVIIGLPLFIGELVLGRQAQRSAVGVFDKFAKGSGYVGIGWLSVATALLMLGWYCVVAGWGINYALLSLADSFDSLSIVEVKEKFIIFRNSGELNILWQALFILTNVMIIMKGVANGIEQFSKWITSALFILVITLLCYSATLPAFGEAFRYVLYPSFDQLTADSVLKALSLALLTLSLGHGVMVTYGGYLNKSDDIPKNALIIAATNFFISIGIALMIFPMVFSLNQEPQAGEGLIFQTLPFVFANLPGSLLISLLFFALLIFAALTSSVSMFEASVGTLVDLYSWSRRKATIFSASIAFVLGIPVALSGSSGVFPTWHTVFGLSFLDTIDVFTGWSLAIVALFTSIFMGYRLPENIRKQGFTEGSNLGFLYKPWLFSVRVIIPAAIEIILLHKAHII